MQLLEDPRQRVQPEVVQLDVLTRRELRLSLAEVERQSSDRAELRRGEASGGELDPRA